jgi:hypothetical protein
MPHLSDEQRRALRLLARHPAGCNEASMLAHGFKLDFLGDLVFETWAATLSMPLRAWAIVLPLSSLMLEAVGRGALESLKSVINQRPGLCHARQNTATKPRR